MDKNYREDNLMYDLFETRSLVYDLVRTTSSACTKKIVEHRGWGEAKPHQILRSTRKRCHEREGWRRQPPLTDGSLQGVFSEIQEEDVIST